MYFKIRSQVFFLIERKKTCDQTLKYICDLARTGIYFASSISVAENRTRWTGIVVKSSVPQQNLQDYGGNHINEHFKRKIRDLRKPLAAAIGLTLESVKPFAKTKV